MKKDSIKIKSSLGSEFSSNVEIGGEKYFIETEEGGTGNPSIITRVYRNGRIIYTKETDCKDIVDVPDREKKIHERKQKQRELAINVLAAEKARVKRTPSDCLEAVRTSVARKKEKSALLTVIDALELYPDNPFLLSYYGYLNSSVNKNYRDGINACMRALEALKKTVPFGQEFFYPLLYLNLGKAYLASGKKREALEAFNRGLDMDSENAEIHRMMKKLGARKNPAIPFLKRSHFLNKYTGMLLHKFRK